MEELRVIDGSGEGELCPACKADLRGHEIPEIHQEFYGGAKYYSKLIGVYDVNKDRITKWRCPKCKAEWDRS